MRPVAFWVGTVKVQVLPVQFTLKAPVEVASVKLFPVAVPPAVIWVVVVTKEEDARVTKPGFVQLKVSCPEDVVMLRPVPEVANAKVFPATLLMRVVVVRIFAGIVVVQVVPVQFTLKVLPEVEVAKVSALPRAVPPAVRATDVAKALPAASIGARPKRQVAVVEAVLDASSKTVLLLIWRWR